VPDPPKPLYRWYDLDYLVPYRDLIFVIGFAVFETGVFLIPGIGLPAGLITTGAGLMYAAWRILLKP
jgi:hypothetical protein